MATKKHIRNIITQRKATIATEDIKLASQKITNKVITLPEFITASFVYVYVAFNSEVETREIIKKAWQSDKRIAVPKVYNRELHFYEITSFKQLKPSSMGILEPDDCVKVEIEDALVVVPGVAFDEERNRIGYGGGYYDRYLTKHRKHKTVAIAFDFQMVDEIPVERFDVKPTILITESKTIY